MQRLFEWADSEISRVDTAGSTVALHFAAAVLHSGGQSHFSNGLVITLQGATVSGDAAHAMGRIANASLHTANARLLRLPVPSQYTATQAPLRLALHMANGTDLHLEARSLQCDEAADASSVERFQC